MFFAGDAEAERSLSMLAARCAAIIDLIVRAVRGEDMFVRPRFPDAVPVEMAPIAEKALANEAAFEATLAKWLSQRRQP